MMTRLNTVDIAAITHCSTEPFQKQTYLHGVCNKIHYMLYVPLKKSLITFDSSGESCSAKNRTFSILWKVKKTI